jgi:hypothetical protein
MKKLLLFIFAVSLRSACLLAGVTLNVLCNLVCAYQLFELSCALFSRSSHKCGWNKIPQTPFKNFRTQRVFPNFIVPHVHKRTARLVIVLWAFNPSSVFTIVVYSESLFSALTLTALRLIYTASSRGLSVGRALLACVLALLLHRIFKKN